MIYQLFLMYKNNKIGSQMYDWCLIILIKEIRLMIPSESFARVTTTKLH